VQEPLTVEERIVEFLKRHPYSTKKEIRLGAKVGQSQAIYVTEKMASEGRLRRKQNGSSVIFWVPEKERYSP
jgi:hypothetical protein